MQRLDDILHLARNNGYSDVHLGGENHIMMRKNGHFFLMNIHILLKM